MATKNKKPPKLIIASVILFTIILIVFSCLFNKQQSIYKIIAIDIIMLWLGIFVTYFIWALYFYNFNYGISQGEWDKIQAAKEARRKGETYNLHDINEEPKYNPYKEQTFGFPGGTVRGMIAFTLLFGALALLIVSFDPTLFDNQQSFFFEQFEFYKTAFLMMIAFYFGSRSLEYLRNKSKPTDAKIDEPGEPTEVVAEIEAKETETSSESPNEAPVANTPKIEVNVDGNVSKIPMITHINDPMSH